MDIHALSQGTQRTNPHPPAREWRQSCQEARLRWQRYGFPRHFEGKSDLFTALIRAELQRTAKRFSAIAPGDLEAATKALAAYLSLNHVKHPEAGCALPSLTPEVGRADESVRDAFQSGMIAIHAIIAERLTGSSDTAWTLIAQSVGAVMLARAMRGETVRRELLGASARQGAAMLRTPADGAARR
jgi:TetR/AcrR family transcriptional regulator, transcriptional repressor for nem operon